MSGDAAVLRLATRVPLTHAPLACPPSVDGHRFSVHGFPRDEAAVRQARGRLGGASGPAGEWVQVESESGTGWPVEHGFSGAPVFDERVGAVVGIIAMRDSHRSGHMLPVQYLRAVWPWLAGRVGWRLDLDPELRTHWLPRAKGSEVASDTGAWYFTGRHAARQAVCDWLAGDANLLVVSGGPGTGKSALVAHLLVAADRVLGNAVPDDGPRPPVGAFDIAVHATGLTRDEVVDRLAAAAEVTANTPRQLLVALRDRHKSGRPPLTVLVDAVEEAATVDEALRIAVFLRELATAGAARVLAAVRSRQRERGAHGCSTRSAAPRPGSTWSPVSSSATMMSRSTSSGGSPARMQPATGTYRPPSRARSAGSWRAERGTTSSSRSWSPAG